MQGNLKNASVSAGPVGPSDGAGNHNTTRIMRTCDAAGTILQPEKPMTPIDATCERISLFGGADSL
jgi:hypothetical protein|eukprot:COSAG06_NODE_645_length_13467_cov_16.309321_8_plen_66_part_00